MTGNYERIYRVVEMIPRGRVATYGQVARLAGLPRNARQVGYALSRLPRERRAPWHRVVNSKGEIAIREHPYAHLEQKSLLEREKVVFDKGGRIPLARFQWEK